MFQIAKYLDVIFMFKTMNMFVFCHQVFRSKVFDSENMFVYISECLVIYKFILMHSLSSVYIYMDQDMTKRYRMVVLIKM